MNDVTALIRWGLCAAAMLGAMAFANRLDIHLSSRRPPHLTPEQLAREVAYLEAHYRQDRCIHLLSEAAPEAILPPEAFASAPSSSPSASAYYQVIFEGSDLISDGFTEVITIHKVTRQAYITRSGGFMGGSVTRGPMPLDTCLQPVFTTALNP